jgi:ABC-type microcin C transport system permease subunit YejB
LHTKATNTLSEYFDFGNSFFENRAVCEKMCKNFVEQDIPQVAIWRVCFAYQGYKQYFEFGNSFFENRAVCEKMCKNFVEPDIPQMAIWRVRFAYQGYKHTLRICNISYPL